MPDAGETIRDGRYAIVRLLAEGGQAASFEAVDKKTGSLVVVKRFRVRGAASWKDVELAEREARVLAMLAHPALPRYVDHFEEGGELYLVTEHIAGESLAEIKHRGAPFDEADAVRLLRDASSALDYLHRRPQPIIHRDLKPSNVIRKPDNSFVLIDFGAVRDRMKPEGGSTVVGTFGYMAPEQFQGRALPASDVYAVGATLLTMLTGREPEDLPHRGLAVDVRAALGDRVSRGLLRALEAMLEPDPDRRAARIAPLLSELDDRARRPRASDGRGRPDARSIDERHPRHADRKRARKEAKRAEREARRAERASRRAERDARWRASRAQRFGDRASPELPALFRIAALLALTCAQLALIAVLRVALPIALTLLSLVFGRGLRDAAERVASAGRAAGDALARAKDAVAGRAVVPTEPPPADARPDEPPVRRVRVAPASAAPSPAGPREAAGEAEREQEEEEESLGPQERVARKR